MSAFSLLLPIFDLFLFLLFKARLDNNLCELRQAQETLSVLGSIYSPLFPKPLTGLISEIQRVKRIDDNQICQDRSIRCEVEVDDENEFSARREILNSKDGVIYHNARLSSTLISATEGRSQTKMENRAEDEDDVETINVLHQGSVYDAVPLLRVQLSKPLSVSHVSSLPYSLDTNEDIDIDNSSEEESADSSDEEESSDSSSEEENINSDKEESSDSSSEKEIAVSCNEGKSTDLGGIKESSESKYDGICTEKAEADNIPGKEQVKFVKSGTSPAADFNNLKCIDNREENINRDFNYIKSSNDSGSGQLLCYTSSHRLSQLAYKIMRKLALVKSICDQKSIPLGTHENFATSPSGTQKCNAPVVKTYETVQRDGTNVTISTSDPRSIKDIPVNLNNQNIAAASDIRTQLLSRNRKRVFESNSEGVCDRGLLSISPNPPEEKINSVGISDIPVVTLDSKLLTTDAHYNNTECLPLSPPVGMQSITTSDYPKIETNFGKNETDFDVLNRLQYSKPATSTVSSTVSLTVSSTALSSISNSLPIHIPYMPRPSISDITITFLGTGSATPSKHRNNSCILIAVPMIHSFIPPYPLNVFPAHPPHPPNYSHPHPLVNPNPNPHPPPPLYLHPPLRPHSSLYLHPPVDSSFSLPTASPQNSFKMKQTQQNQTENIILLDVGEGTCTQLFQSVGGDIDRFNNYLINIRLIWISHHHADHICGLPLLLEHINRALIMKSQSLHDLSNNDQSNSAHKIASVAAAVAAVVPHKVTVIGPPVVLKYQEYCACVAGLDDLVTFVPTVSTLFASYSIPLPLPLPLSGMCPTRLLVRSIQVPHCKESYALVLNIQRDDSNQRYHSNKDIKIVYSGDCRPSSSLINAGKDCDLLLHEATFDDTMQKDAECKRHCTTSEAVDVGVRMKAKHIVLTHFSQRYPTAVQSFSNKPNLKKGVQEGSTYSTNHIVSTKPFSVAFDLLQFSFPSQIQYLPLATNALTNILIDIAAAAAAAAATTTATTTIATNGTINIEAFEAEEANY